MSEISKEYAAALFMLACEKDSADECLASLEKIKTVFSENPDYAEFISAPSIAKSERLAAIEQAFSAAVCEDALSYLMLLCEKGRMACFYESVEEFKKLLDASKHIRTAKVTSAAELTDSEKQALKQKLETTGKSIVNMEYFIDKSLLGGLIVEIDGKILDGSLRSRLRDIKEVIST